LRQRHVISGSEYYSSTYLYCGSEDGFHTKTAAAISIPSQQKLNPGIFPGQRKQKPIKFLLHATDETGKRNTVE
jgi:hypothetical protein